MVFDRQLGQNQLSPLPSEQLFPDYQVVSLYAAQADITYSTTLLNAVTCVALSSVHVRAYAVAGSCQFFLLIERNLPQPCI